jgi:uncharacterized membrane protein (TIGR02234 family)
MPVVTASFTGRQLVPAAVGAAVMLLAGVAGVIATRGWGRRLLGAVLALAAVGMGVAAGGFGLALPESARPAAVAETGFDNVTIVGSSWWLVVVGAGALAAVAAVLVTVRGAGWPVLGGRYERGPATPKGTSMNPAAMTPAQAWDALDRGEDPTTAAEVTE